MPPIRPRRRAARKMFVEEREHFLPAFQHRLGLEAGPLVIEEGVADAVVAIELVSFAEFLQERLGAVHLVRRRIPVVVAEQADQRNSELLGEVDRRHRALVVEHLRIVDDDVAAPAVDHRVEAGHRAGGEVGVTPAGAEAHHRDLAVAVGSARAGTPWPRRHRPSPARRERRPPRARVRRCRRDCRGLRGSRGAGRWRRSRDARACASAPSSIRPSRACGGSAQPPDTRQGRWGVRSRLRRDRRYGRRTRPFPR